MDACWYKWNKEVRKVEDSSVSDYKLNNLALGRLGRRQFENLSSSSCLVLSSPKAGHQLRTWKRQFIWKVIPGSKSDSEEGKTMHRCGVAWATAIASGGRSGLYLLKSKTVYPGDWRDTSQLCIASMGFIPFGFWVQNVWMPESLGKWL